LDRVKQIQAVRKEIISNRLEVDSPAPEWLDPEFHSSKAFKLPEKSRLIESSLFWYYVDLVRDPRQPWQKPGKGNPGIEIYIPGINRD